jgi:hypothetical protein
VSPAISSSAITQAGISTRDEVHSSLAPASKRAVAIETGIRPLGVDASCDAPADSRGPALGHANGAVLFTVEVPTTPPLSSVAPVLGSEDASDINLQVLDLRNGPAFAHANGHARDHVHGNARRRDESLRLASRSAEAAFNRAQSLYDRGQIDLLPLLDAQRTRLSVRVSSNDSDTQLLLDSVRLYKALGGGWQAFEPLAANASNP